jgi:hypothetical protein
LGEVDHAAGYGRAEVWLTFHQIAHQSHCRPLREFCFDLRPTSANSPRIAAASICLSMISAQTRSAFVARENRLPLFRIML